MNYSLTRGIRIAGSFYLALIMTVGTPLLFAGCSPQEGETGNNTPVVEGEVQDGGGDSTEVAGSSSALIEAEELKTLIESGEEFVLLEPYSDAEKFQQRHIPGAVGLHWVTDMIDPDNSTRYTNLSSEQFAALMSRLGVSSDSHVIICDRLTNRLSTRLFWMFKYFGHDSVQILNGGVPAWYAQEYELTDVIPEVVATEYTVGEVKQEFAVALDFIKQHLEDSNMKLVDGRPQVQFSGQEAGKVFHTGEPHANLGHIPAAENVFWKDNFQEDGRFKSAEDLASLYQEKGIEADNCVVTYCNEGLHAAPPWFVLTEILGYEDVRLYDDSMAEWANSDNPIESTVEESGEDR